MVLFLALKGFILSAGIDAWGKWHGMNLRSSPFSRIRPDWIELKNATLANPRGEIFFSSPSIKFSFRGLWRLSEVELDQPSVDLSAYSAGALGNWKSGETNLPRKIRFLAHVKDGEVILGENSRKTSFDHISGTADLTDSQFLVLNLRNEKVRCAGKFVFPPFSGLLGIEGRNLPLSVLNDRFTSGLLDAHLKYVASNGSLLLYGGSLTGKQGTWGNGPLKASGLDFNAGLGGEVVRLDSFNGMLNGKRFSGSGVLYGFHNPVFSGKVRFGPEVLTATGKLTPNGGEIGEIFLPTKFGWVQGGGTWHGGGNPRISGLLWGNIKGTPVAAKLSGTLLDGYAMGSSGLVRWTKEGLVEGTASLQNFPISYRFGKVPVRARLSGRTIFQFSNRQAPEFIGQGSWSSMSIGNQRLKPGKWGISLGSGDPKFFLNMPSARLYGALAYRSGVWESPGLRAVAGGGLYDLSGTFDPARRIMRLAGRVERGSLSAMQAFALGTDPWPVSGSFTGSFALNGPPDRLSGAVHAFLHDGEIFGQAVSSAFADLYLDKGMMRFDPLVMRFRENYLIGRGTVDPRGNARLKFEVPQLSLSDVASLTSRLGLVTGKASLHGEMTGNFNNPRVSGNLEAQDVAGPFWRLDRVLLKGRYFNHVLKVGQSEIDQGPGKLTGDFSYGFYDPADISANLVMSEVNLESLLSWPGFRYFGPLEGEVSVKGPLNGLDGDFDFELGKTGLVSGRASGVVNGSTVSFTTLHLNAGGGAIAGSGEIVPQQPSLIHLSGNHLNLETLAKIFRWPGRWKGMVDLGGTVAVSIQHPEMILRASVLRPAYNQYHADLLKGNLVYRNGRLDIEEGELLQGSDVMDFSGTVGGRGVKSPIQIHLSLDHQDLSFLSGYFPGLGARGTVNGNLDIGGTPRDLAASGNLEIQHGTFLFPGLSNPAENVNGALNFEGNRIRGAFQGELGNPFSMEGDFSWNPADLSHFPEEGNLRLTGRSLRVSIPGSANLTMSPDLTLSRKPASWALTGRSTLDDGEIDIGTRPEKSLSSLGNLELAADVALTDKVRLIHPHMQTEGSGLLHLSGSAAHPRVSGTLSTTGGTLEFLGHPFRVRKADAVFDAAHDLPYLDIHAVSSGRIQGALIFLNLKGYPDDLRLRMNSDPPLTEDEVASTLTQQQPASRGAQGYEQNAFMRQEAARWISAGIQAQLLSPLEGAFQSALNLEDFSFELLPSGQLGLRVGEPVSPHMDITYTRPLTPYRISAQVDPPDVWGVEYHLNPKITLRATQDNVYGYGGMVLSQWQF